jgi:WD40 repeat protein
VQGIEIEIKTLSGHTSYVLSLAVLPDGSLASGSSDTKIKIWDTIKGIEIKTLSGHTSYVLSLAVLPDGSLASGSSDTKIKIWDTLKGIEIKTSYRA